MSTAPLVTPQPNSVVPDGETFRFDYPGSDIVLHSSDFQIFRVPKLYILNSSDSPTLRQLIQNASNTSDVANGEKQDSLPVVKLPEDGATLHSLLTFIFPVAPILPSTSEMIMELLSIAQKYQMDAVSTHIRGAISRLDPPFMRPETAFQHYALAQKYELRQEVIQAARITLRQSLTLDSLGDKIDFMPGVYLRELWKYHERVRTDLRSRLPEFRQTGLPDPVKNLRCNYSSPQSFPPWLDGYINSLPDNPHLISVIELENIRTRHIKDEHARRRSTSNPYSSYSSPVPLCSCAEISSQNISAFWDALTAEVRRTMEMADPALTLVKEEPTYEFLDPPSVPLSLDTPEANIVLRSSDQVTFRVHKSLLVMSSPLFKDLLSIPQPVYGDHVDGLPVVQLSESAGLLTCLISLLYPIDPTVPNSYEKVFALLAACQKYEMTSIQSRIRSEVKLGVFPGPVGAEAFRAYAIASSIHLVPEMERAAQLTRSHQMTFESLGEALASFKGQALGNLLRSRNL